MHEDKGPHRILGENVTVAAKRIVAVCLQLNEVGALPYETMMDVLTGLTNSSISDFVRLFGFLLQQAKEKPLDADIYERNTLENVKSILSKANDFYHSLCAAGKWHVRNKSSGHFNVVCWNCEKEGCSVNKCPQLKDQKKIAANMKKFSKQKQNSRGINGKSKITGSDDFQNYN